MPLKGTTQTKMPVARLIKLDNYEHIHWDTFATVRSKDELHVNRTVKVITPQQDKFGVVVKVLPQKGKYYNAIIRMYM